MLRIGLTGGIASGKSTVARAFRALGTPVVDADALYHGLVAPRGGEPSPLAARIGQRFAGVLAPDGTLVRQALAAHVFSDPAARIALEAISHPAVALAAEEAFAAHAAAGAKWAMYDVPLLYERNLADKFAGVVVVWVPRAVQLLRLAARDGLHGEAAELRLAAQLPLAHKRALADYTIDNSQTPAHATAQVQALWHTLEARAERPQQV